MLRLAPLSSSCGRTARNGSESLFAVAPIDLDGSIG
jgi:hypothetical protein